MEVIETMTPTKITEPVLNIWEDPRVIQAQARLAEGERGVQAAEEAVARARRDPDAARDALAALRIEAALGETSAAAVTAAKGRVQNAEAHLSEVLEDLDSKRRALPILQGRVREAEEGARREVETVARTN